MLFQNRFIVSHCPCRSGSLGAPRPASAVPQGHSHIFLGVSPDFFSRQISYPALNKVATPPGTSPKTKYFLILRLCLPLARYSPFPLSPGSFPNVPRVIYMWPTGWYKILNRISPQFPVPFVTAAKASGAVSSLFWPGRRYTISGNMSPGVRS